MGNAGDRHCKVTGYGKDYKNDSYGTDVQVSFRRLKAALTARYAGGKDYEYLKSDALWKEDNEWNWSILKNERSLTTFWEAKYGSRMPLGVTNVMLDVRAVNSSATYLVLSYEFSNLAQCAKIQDQVRSSGL